MAAEGSHDGAWNDWRWKTPDHWSSSSSSIPRAGWTWHGWKRHPPWSNQGWLPWNSPVDTTSKDPRQYGGERARLFPHWTKSWLGWRPACWTPAKAKPKNRPMSGAGDSRRDHMSLRQHSRRRLRRRESASTSHRKMPCPRRFLELVLCKGSSLCPGGLCPRPSRQMRFPTTSWRRTARKRWP